MADYYEEKMDLRVGLALMERIAGDADSGQFSSQVADVLDPDNLSALADRRDLVAKRVQGAG